jgi:hypothetical protein
MWATFDDSGFPKIKITLNGVPENNNDFTDFLTKWDSYNGSQYNNEKYVFLFDTTNVGMVNPKYAKKMGDFIKDLKKKPQHLKASVIKCNSSYTRFLLRIIFWLQKPVANVYIISNNDDRIVNSLTNLLLTGTHMNFNNEYTTVVYA